ncbi:MAG TPA: tRNA (adenosine(37)-N6)-threonylcarbamoyltransferase complex ATPase subunit type 1 TsaE [Kofleriaceae bacterium]|nr:tRNA (adenosine(37)-N6)-threonylcarbamoyltransferase complex ATPase subunit type 1 TsaE [Kofleriaceae bacterium]
MSTFALELADPGATRAAGVALGRALGPGDVVALVGELGAGKTTLVGGVVEGAGGDAAAVASPTFSLVNDYAGPLPIAHVDLYRLERERDLDELGLDEVWGVPPRATLVEWADRFAGRLPVDRVEVTLAHRAAGRLLTAVAHGPRARGVLEAWRRVMGG